MLNISPHTLYDTLQTASYFGHVAEIKTLCVMYNKQPLVEIKKGHICITRTLMCYAVKKILQKTMLIVKNSTDFSLTKLHLLSEGR